MVFDVKFGMRLLVLPLLLGPVACQQAGVTPPESQAQIARDAGDVTDPTEIVALVADEAAAERLSNGAVERGYVYLRGSRLGGLGLNQIVFRIPDGTDGPGAIRELEAMEPGSTVGVNHAYRLQAEGRVYAPGMLAWPETGCVADVPVGMIDGVVDRDAAALGGARIVQRDFTGGSPAAVEHGTAVAEILAGPGRLTGAEVFSAVVVSDGPGGDEAAGVDTLMRAFDWLSQSGVRLVNVSLAGPYNKILDRGLQAADARGMVVIAAAGNSGSESPPRYPAAFSQTIAVTAVDAAMAPYAKAPTGGHIDFAAPGVDIFLQLDGGGRYLSGTSLAAPFVTALVAGEGVGGSAQDIRARLARGAVDLGESGRDEVFGLGLPQAVGACG